MHEAKRVELLRSVVSSVASSQRELCSCFDLLVEVDGGLVVQLQPRLFAAHRALGEVSVAARSLAGPDVCWLLRHPGG